jgi:hypothetical protein
LDLCTLKRKVCQFNRAVYVESVLHDIPIIIMEVQVEHVPLLSDDLKLSFFLLPRHDGKEGWTASRQIIMYPSLLCFLFS